MTTEAQFDANEWICRLGASLETVAAGSEYSLELEGGRSSNLTREDLRAVHDSASGHTAISVSVSGKLISRLTEQHTVLRDHPVLRRALRGTGDNEGLMFLNPGGECWESTRDLAFHLVRVSAKSTGQNAARLLHRYLTDGESRQLEAREFVVIYGLKIAERIDLGDGSFLAPLDDRFISQEGFAEEEADKLKTFGVGRRNFQKDSGGSVVFVRDMKWGPGVAPAPKGHQLDLVKVAYRFPCDVETVANLLSVASRCPLATSARHTRLAKWIRNTHTNFESGLWSSTTFRLDGWWDERDLSGEAECRFRNTVAGWTGFQFNSDLERMALNLAIWRLSGSFTRVGGWEVQDRILDYAIALEILYRLDSSELTYKLGTRAACLLGDTSEKRRETFERITEFYDIRSAIVHGPTTKKHKKLGHEDFERACANGRDLACDTLSELLQRGRFPDWKDLILGEPVPHIAHP